MATAAIVKAVLVLSVDFIKAPWCSRTSLIRTFGCAQTGHWQEIKSPLERKFDRDLAGK